MLVGYNVWVSLGFFAHVEYIISCANDITIVIVIPIMLI